MGYSHGSWYRDFHYVTGFTAMIDLPFNFKGNCDLIAIEDECYYEFAVKCLVTEAAKSVNSSLYSYV